MIDNPRCRDEENNKIENIINPKQTSLVENIGGQECDKNDPVVRMLNTCKRQGTSRKTIKDNMNKLMDRVKLDRPILQREKIRIIMMERFNDGEKVEDSSEDEDDKMEAQRPKELKVS